MCEQMCGFATMAALRNWVESVCLVVESFYIAPTGLSRTLKLDLYQST